MEDEVGENSLDLTVAPPVVLESDTSDVEDVFVPLEGLDTTNSPPHEISGMQFTMMQLPM